MSRPDSFDDAFTRLTEGDEDAAAEVFGRYANRLIHLARSRLDGRMRRKMDPDDVVQSVFRSFFVRQADGQFELEGWDNLWSLLARITLASADAGQQLCAGRRDVRRELVEVASGLRSHASWEAPAR